ncbi:hypothetical protein HY642_02720 [Candidatus Woesearchaeota archaeon]|nr:hypothetical protein [Candidatus Woesearchaeota archaeon]
MSDTNQMRLTPFQHMLLAYTSGARNFSKQDQNKIRSVVDDRMLKLVHDMTNVLRTSRPSYLDTPSTEETAQA